MTKPISLVTRIQRDVANSAFQEMEEKMAMPLEKRGSVSKGVGKLRVRKSGANKRLAGSGGEDEDAEPIPKYSAEELEKQRLLAVARVVSRRKTESEKKKAEEESRNSSKFAETDLEKMRLAAAQRAMEAQREAKAQREKESLRKKMERDSRASERRREEEAKVRRRAEIYAINNVMKDAFEEKFRQFAAEQLANGEGHSIVSEELGLAEEDVRGVEIGKAGDSNNFSRVGAV